MPLTIRRPPTTRQTHGRDCGELYRRSNTGIHTAALGERVSHDYVVYGLFVNFTRLMRALVTSNPVTLRPDFVN